MQRNTAILQNNLILPKTRSSRIPGFSKRPRSDRIPSEIITQKLFCHFLHVVSGYHQNRGWTGKNKKLEISVAAVCTSVNILKVREIVDKINKFQTPKNKLSRSVQLSSSTLPELMVGMSSTNLLWKCPPPPPKKKKKKKCYFEEIKLFRKLKSQYAAKPGVSQNQVISQSPDLTNLCIPQSPVSLYEVLNIERYGLWPVTKV